MVSLWIRQTLLVVCRAHSWRDDNNGKRKQTSVPCNSEQLRSFPNGVLTLILMKTPESPTRILTRKATLNEADVLEIWIPLQSFKWCSYAHRNRSGRCSIRRSGKENKLGSSRCFVNVNTFAEFQVELLRWHTSVTESGKIILIMKMRPDSKRCVVNANVCVILNWLSLSEAHESEQSRNEETCRGNLSRLEQMCS